MNIRTRFAPSPTGYLHIGSMRTALFAFLFARHNNGTFVLRIEDTDQARFVTGAIEKTIEALQSVAITYDEGIYIEDGKLVSRGAYGPYLQSERTNQYKKYAEQLVVEGNAYYCFCNEERIAELRKEQEALKKPTQYDRKCRFLSKEQIAENLAKELPHVIRQAIPLKGQTVIHDLVFSDIVYEHKTLDDQVLLKSDGFPTYHLAVVIDDHLMEISHVIRGNEWLPSTPKHILLYQSFGWTPPVYAHLGLLLNKDHSKLSKRQGDVSLEDYLRKGYVKEAITNFVAFLGWNPKTEQELFSMDQLIEAFDLAHVNKGGSIFDVEKLDWYNGLYIKKMTTVELAEHALPYLLAEQLFMSGPDEGSYITTTGRHITSEYIQAVLALEQERLKKFSDIGLRVGYFFTAPMYVPQILIWKKSNQQTTKENLSMLLDFLTVLPESTLQNQSALETAVKQHIIEKGLDNGSVLWPLRVALSGLEASPSPFEIGSVIAQGLGKDEVLHRIRVAIQYLA